MNLDWYFVREGSPPTDSKWLQTPAGRVRLVTRGSGRPVLLMPDPPNVIEHILPLIDDLARDHRVIAFEGPGFGYSQQDRSFGFTLEEQAQTIGAILEAEAAEGAILALTCVAGLSALRAANLQPDRIAGLLLAQTASLETSIEWARRVDFKGIIGTPVLGQLALRLGRGPLTRKWYANAVAKGTPTDSLETVAMSAYAAGASFCLASAFQALRRETDSARLKVRQPVHVVWGGADRTHRRTAPTDVLAHAPHGTAETFDGCGHFPDIERVGEFAASVRAFSKRLGAVSAQ